MIPGSGRDALYFETNYKVSKGFGTIRQKIKLEYEPWFLAPANEKIAAADSSIQRREGGGGVEVVDI